jgi:hypothetical protein
MADRSLNIMIKKYGLFAGILCIMFFILIIMTLMTRKSWDKGLQMQTQTVLDSFYTGGYIVGDAVQLNSPFAVSAACFKVRFSSGQEGYAVILRMVTIYGPLPGVFICRNGSVPIFAGFANSGGRVSSLLNAETQNVRIHYWQNRLMKILKDSGVEND